MHLLPSLLISAVIGVIPAADAEAIAGSADITAAAIGAVAHYDRQLDGGRRTTSHGDGYNTAWSRDGTLFCLTDDSKGFDGELRDKAGGNRNPGRNLVVSILTGRPGAPDFHGAAVFGRHQALACFGGENEGDASLPRGGIWKGSGLGSYDGVLYLTVNDQTRNFPDRKVRATGAAILRSPDGGLTWQTHDAAPDGKPKRFMFADPRFSRIDFVRYGQDGRAPGSPHGSDAFVYATSNDGAWDNGDSLYLARVRRDALPRLEAGDWRFFAGMAGGEPRWGTLAEMQPVFTRPGTVSQTTMFWLPSRRRYILPNWHYVRDPALVPAMEGYYGTASSGHTAWEFYAAETPWGPWHPERPFFTRDWPTQGYYSPSLVDAFSAGDRLVILCSANYWDAGEYGLHHLEMQVR